MGFHYVLCVAVKTREALHKTEAEFNLDPKYTSGVELPSVIC